LQKREREMLVLKFGRKLLTSFFLIATLLAFMITPAFASVQYVSGSCSGYPCSGSTNASIWSARATTSFSHGGYVYAKIEGMGIEVGGTTFHLDTIVRYSANATSISATTYISHDCWVDFGKGTFQVVHDNNQWNGTVTAYYP
jgi:hypothetical protein